MNTPPPAGRYSDSTFTLIAVALARSDFGTLTSTSRSIVGITEAAGVDHRL